MSVLGEVGTAPTQAALALTALAADLRHKRPYQQPVKVSAGLAGVMLPWVEASREGARRLVVVVFCHDPDGTGLVFCTNRCRRLGSADQVAQVADAVRKMLAAPAP